MVQKTTWEDTTGKDVFGMAVCQLIYDISLEIILMFDMWFMMFPMCDIMNHVTSRFTDRSSERSRCFGAGCWSGR